MEFNKRNVRIYVLSGKAGTGKNEVARIIHDIYAKRNIKTINLAYASYLKDYAKNVLDWDGNEDTKPREFLQQVGIELIKNKLGKTNMLINRLKDDIDIYSYFYDVITISDARFAEEIDIIRNNYPNVTVINIYGKDNKLKENEKKHITEVALDNYNEYDYKIDNSILLNELERVIENIIGEVNE